ncbi:PAP2 superfamily protein [Cecembia calidifontis]|uniref:PAP2 superfamily protein n=1 Tax=Cecembia calidifontis TaxID=1187080 RepID=A0A4Q7PDD8_9BACT|nr:PAP2 superfamily protein [Cecembia calidifontis]
MYRKLALFISYLFQPLLIPTLVFLYLIYGATHLVKVSYFDNRFLVAMVFLTTFIIPLLSVVMMRLTKNIGSFHMHSKEERVFPFSMISLFYMITTYLFYLKFRIDPALLLALVVITISVIILTSVTFFWKISAHMTGISGLVAIIFAIALKYPSYDYLALVIGSILAAGLVGSSRLYLNAHTPGEIFGGFILGFSICFSAFYWLL